MALRVGSPYTVQAKARLRRGACTDATGDPVRPLHCMWSPVLLEWGEEDPTSVATAARGRELANVPCAAASSASGPAVRTPRLRQVKLVASCERVATENPLGLAPRTLTS